MYVRGCINYNIEARSAAALGGFQAEMHDSLVRFVVWAVRLRDARWGSFSFEPAC